MRWRPTPSMAVAFTALLVALGGTGYAATKLPAKSVGRAQIRDGAVGPTQIRRDAVGAIQIRAASVGTSEIADGAVQAKDLAKGVVPVATSTPRQATGDPVAPGASGAASVACNAGERLTGGGGGFAGPPTVNDKVSESIPVGESGPPRWRVTLFNGGTAPRTPVAYAICEAG